MIPAAYAPSMLDVLIVGAGLSGIGAALHLQARIRARRYAILEARAALGGTWDLFRFPGIRSDSDMHTFGYPFRPWTGDKAIADGASILAYVARDGARARHRPAHPLRPSRRARGVVERRRALDRDGRADGAGETVS